MIVRMRIPRRFSLRTLLLATTATVVLTACVSWLSWNIRQVREREKYPSLTETFLTGKYFPGTLVTCCPNEFPPPKSLPWLWSVLGAKPVFDIIVDPSVAEKDYQRIVSLFPEADVHRGEFG